MIATLLVHSAAPVTAWFVLINLVYLALAFLVIRYIYKFVKSRKSKNTN
jgi:hypothetical protein